MIAIILSELKNIDNPMATKLVDLVNQNIPSVDDSTYETTVWESKENYGKKIGVLTSRLEGNFGKQLVETPLTFVRGQKGSVWSAQPGKGMTTGLVLFHYVTKTPLLLVLIDKETGGYSYKSLKLNSTTKQYESLTDETQSFTDFKDFIEFCGSKLSSDIETFVETK